MILFCTARILSPDFFKKCRIQPISQVQWQIANFILEFKSTHPKGTIFDGIRFGPVFWLLKDFFHDVTSIDIKGFSFNFGRKIFTGFEMAELESYSFSFFDILCNEKEEKCGSVTFKFCHFKASEDFLAKIEWEPLDINTNEWQKVDDCCYLSSLLRSNFKKDFYVLSLYWGMNTFVYHCKYFENLPKETVVI